MAHKEWQAILEDWRKVPARRRYQGAKSSRVCSDDEGEEGGEESGEAVRSAAQGHCKENSEV